MNKKFLLLLFLFLFFITNFSWAESNNSLFSLDSVWINQNNKKVKLSDFKGKKQVISMIYSSCGYTCPIIIKNMKEIQKKLPKSQKDKVKFVLISFTPDIDTPDVFKKYQEANNLDNNWELLIGKDEDVRAISLLLDIKYKKEENKTVSHSNIITILDENGKIIAQANKLTGVVDPLLKAVKGK